MCRYMGGCPLPLHPTLCIRLLNSACTSTTSIAIHLSFSAAGRPTGCFSTHDVRHCTTPTPVNLSINAIAHAHVLFDRSSPGCIRSDGRPSPPVEASRPNASSGSSMSVRNIMRRVRLPREPAGGWNINVQVKLHGHLWVYIQSWVSTSCVAVMYSSLAWQSRAKHL